MKHSIINELYTCNKVLSVLENENQAIISIETYRNPDGFEINVETFTLSKENLHSFIGTLLHVQQKLKGGK